MAPYAFMTINVWEQMTPNVVKGLRNINPVVAANPQWFMIEIVDGFSAHLGSLIALQLCYENKIMCLNEEGDSSHVNQAYDKYVAKNDKRICFYSLSIQQNYHCKN